MKRQSCSRFEKKKSEITELSLNNTERPRKPTRLKPLVSKQDIHLRSGPLVIHSEGESSCYQALKLKKSHLDHVRGDGTAALSRYADPSEIIEWTQGVEKQAQERAKDTLSTYEVQQGRGCESISSKGTVLDVETQHEMSKDEGQNKTSSQNESRCRGRREHISVNCRNTGKQLNKTQHTIEHLDKLEPKRKDKEQHSEEVSSKVKKPMMSHRLKKLRFSEIKSKVKSLRNDPQHVMKTTTTCTTTYVNTSSSDLKSHQKTSEKNNIKNKISPASSKEGHNHSVDNKSANTFVSNVIDANTTATSCDLKKRIKTSTITVPLRVDIEETNGYASKFSSETPSLTNNVDDNITVSSLLQGCDDVIALESNPKVDSNATFETDGTFTNNCDDKDRTTTQSEERDGRNGQDTHLSFRNSDKADDNATCSVRSNGNSRRQRETPIEHEIQSKQNETANCSDDEIQHDDTDIDEINKQKPVSKYTKAQNNYVDKQLCDSTNIDNRWEETSQSKHIEIENCSEDKMQFEDTMIDVTFCLDGGYPFKCDEEELQHQHQQQKQQQHSRLLNPSSRLLTAHMHSNSDISNRNNNKNSDMLGLKIKGTKFEQKTVECDDNNNMDDYDREDYKGSSGAAPHNNEPTKEIITPVPETVVKTKDDKGDLSKQFNRAKKALKSAMDPEAKANDIDYQNKFTTMDTSLKATGYASALNARADVTNIVRAAMRAMKGNNVSKKVLFGSEIIERQFFYDLDAPSTTHAFRGAFNEPCARPRPKFFTQDMRDIDLEHKRPEMKTFTNELTDQCRRQTMAPSCIRTIIQKNKEAIVAFPEKIPLEGVPSCSLRVQWRISLNGMTPDMPVVFVTLNRIITCISLVRVSVNSACATFLSMAGAEQAMANLAPLSGPRLLIGQWWYCKCKGAPSREAAAQESPVKWLIAQYKAIVDHRNATKWERKKASHIPEVKWTDAGDKQSIRSTKNQYPSTQSSIISITRASNQVLTNRLSTSSKASQRLDTSSSTLMRNRAAQQSKKAPRKSNASGTDAYRAKLIKAIKQHIPSRLHAEDEPSPSESVSESIHQSVKRDSTRISLLSDYKLI